MSDPSAASRHVTSLFPPGCTCSSYGHGLSMTRVTSRTCPVHGDSLSAAAAPQELLDPDGEGIYLRADLIPSTLLRAAGLFFGDWRRWREIDHEGVWMRPAESGDEWVRADIGRRPRGWKLNLPKRWFPVERYVYCTPKPEAM